MRSLRGSLFSFCGRPAFWAPALICAPSSSLSLRYSTPFAHRLASSLSLLSSSRTAFLASPTAYVAFQHLNPQPNALLLEYDARFDVLPGKGFIKWDLFDPERLPESLKGTVELAVVDPPYLNEVRPRRPMFYPQRIALLTFLSFRDVLYLQETNQLVAKSLAFLLHPTKARLLLLTSTSVSFDALRSIYGTLPQLGPLREVTSEEAKVKHDGGRIQNPFGMWASWEGGEGFMGPEQEGRE